MRTYVSGEEVKDMHNQNRLRFTSACDAFVVLYDKAKKDKKTKLIEGIDILVSKPPNKLFFKTGAEVKNPDGEERSKYGKKSGYIRGGPEEIDGTAVTYVLSKDYWALMR